MNNNPIGIFDSGIGGTSIWKEIITLLPGEHSIYLADSKNAPYGEKSPRQILELSVKNTEFLLNKGCKIIVVACNTATTNAISYLRVNYSVPFIGIEPAIKPAALQSDSKVVGVLATKGTLGSSLFYDTSKNYASNIQIVEREGTGLVSLIEAGKSQSKEVRDLLREYLGPMLKANMDHLVLGCTHYPYLIPVLKELLPREVKIIDCGEAVARQTASILRKHQLFNTTQQQGKHQFFTNSDVGILESFLKDVTVKKEVEYLDF